MSVEIISSRPFRSISERSKTRRTVAATTRPYEIAVNSYLARKTQGASAQERLKLLEGLYSQFGSQNIDLVWLAQEFQTLGQPDRRQ